LIVSNHVFCSTCTPSLLQAGGEDDGERMRAFGDRLQPFRTVVDREHARDVGEQHLRGADVEVAFSRRMCCSRVCIARR
jgi:hypothetical protein